MPKQQYYHLRKFSKITGYKKEHCMLSYSCPLPPLTGNSKKSIAEKTLMLVTFQKGVVIEPIYIIILFSLYTCKEVKCQRIMNSKSSNASSKKSDKWVSHTITVCR